MEEGKLRVVGIAEEQHPDRTRLFMQWKGMTWPVLLDSLNLLECKGIPFTLLIDRQGIVRAQNPSEEEWRAFMAEEDDAQATESRKNPDAVASWPSRDSAEGQLLWGGPEAMDEAVARLQEAVREDPEDGRTHFRLGVAYRQRHDSSRRQPGDFAAAVQSWKNALECDPSQYIWRRRIQQYGPRLDKPYSFYDWVDQARQEILDLGQIPQPLVAEPSGAEFAQPAKAKEPAAIPGEDPDPQDRVPVDTQPLVQIEATVVPSTAAETPAFRVHLRLTPNASHQVHWTNDAGPLVFFPEETPGYEIGALALPPVPENQITSSEARVVEYELRPSTNPGDGKTGDNLPEAVVGTAFYYVCEDVDGQCLYLRQKVRIPLP